MESAMFHCRAKISCYSIKLSVIVVLFITVTQDVSKLDN